MAENESDQGQIQVRFYTKQDKFAVPDTPFSISLKINVENLSNLINELLKETVGPAWKEIEFDFLIGGEFLRTSFNDHLKSKDISTENTIDVEYVERFPAPEPEDSLNHDDWVSAAHCFKEWIITGAYDNTVHLWNINGTHELTIPGHCGPVKDVTWVETNNQLTTFASVSQDQTVMLWKLDLASKSVDCIHIGRGHERSIECVDVDTHSSFLATGGWDNMIKIWAATLEENKMDEGLEKEATRKRGRNEGHPPITRTPLMTLPGHKEAISSVVWTENNEIFSSSWDHTIKLWDAELGGLKTEIVGNKSFFNISRSPLNHTLITASADRHVRLYDPRSQEGSLVKSTFTSHVGWVSTVRWSTTHDSLFISGGHDGVLKLWDYRSPKAPLYDMTGHSDKILCADWSNPQVMVSGSSDNTLKLFKANN